MPTFLAGSMEEASVQVNNPNPVPLRTNVILIVGGGDRTSAFKGETGFFSVPPESSAGENLVVSLPLSAGSYEIAAILDIEELDQSVRYNVEGTIDILIPQGPEVIATVQDHGVVLVGEPVEIRFGLTNPDPLEIDITNMIIIMDGVAVSAPRSLRMPALGTLPQSISADPPDHSDPTRVQSMAVNLVWRSGEESNILDANLGTVLTYNLVAPTVSIGI